MLDEPASEVTSAVRHINTKEITAPEIALVLGSGLGTMAEAVENKVVIPTSSVPGYPRSTAPGHKGRLVFGQLEGRNVVVIQGRVHFYEGYPARAVTFPIRLMHALGVQRLVVTNAAGGINKRFKPGTLMFITDHINMAFQNPLIGPNKDGGPRFPDASNLYDSEWLDQAEQQALAHGIPTQRGVYLWTQGPSYETKAEIEAYRRFGADAVGMSTVPEVLQAQYFGMKTLGISTITNPAAGLNKAPLKHEDVLEVGKSMRVKLETLVRAILRFT